MATVTLPGVLLSGTHAARVAANTVAKGTLYAETDTGQIYQSDGSSWSAWGSATIVNPMTTRGDIITGGVSGALQRLALGAAGKILSSDGTDAVWGQGPLTTTGDLLIGATGGTPTRLAAGTLGYVLTSGGPGVAPSWAAGGGGGTPTVTDLGYTTVGASTEATANFRVYCKKITISGKTLIASASMYVKPNAGGNVPPLAAAISLDNAGTPGRIIAVGNPLVVDLAGETSSPVARWVTVPLGIVLGGSAVSGGDADYWIQFAAGPSTNSWTVNYDGSGGDKYYGSSGSWFMDGAIATFTGTTNKYSLFASTMAVG